MEPARGGGPIWDKAGLIIGMVVVFRDVTEKLRMEEEMIRAARRMLEMDPGARIVVSSGYFNDPVMADYRRYGFRGVVAKPYVPETLTLVIQRVIQDSNGD